MSRELSWGVRYRPRPCHDMHMATHKVTRGSANEVQSHGELSQKSNFCAGAVSLTMISCS